jgi:hypothetical protein
MLSMRLVFSSYRQRHTNCAADGMNMSLFGSFAVAITPKSLRSSTAKLKPTFAAEADGKKLKFWYGR